MGLTARLWRIIGGFVLIVLAVAGGVMCQLWDYDAYGRVLQVSCQTIGLYLLISGDDRD